MLNETVQLRYYKEIMKSTKEQKSYFGRIMENKKYSMLKGEEISIENTAQEEEDDEFS